MSMREITYRRKPFSKLENSIFLSLNLILPGSKPLLKKRGSVLIIWRKTIIGKLNPCRLSLERAI